ncbi:DUF262 domain-containing protein [Neotabrizicola shimadae]
MDGQQRLTTLSIIVLAALRRINSLISSGVDAERNQLRLQEIRRSYIGQLDPVSLVVRPKITLNRNNDHYYQNFLATLRDMPVRGFKASEHSMRRATEWFLRQTGSYLESLSRPEDDHGAILAGLIDRMSRGLFFTKIVVDDDLNAYKVFETLNARGVKLSAPDLLKNYLFSVISRDATAEAHDEELDRVEVRWSDILERLQSENVTSFLRAYWGATHSFVRESDLFKVIKRSITTRAEAYALLSGLEDSLETFLALTDPETSSWPADDRENARLLKMFSVRQPFALLMALKRQVPSAFSQVLDAIVRLSFRYNVISNLQPAEQERVYSRVAIEISQGRLPSAASIISELRSIYPNDDLFRANFASKSFDTSGSRNKQVVRYILSKLEQHQSGLAPDSAELTIEHILPERPGAGWRQFSETEAKSDVYRLGNLALIEPSRNQAAGNHDYEVKKGLLSSSGLASTSSIPSEYSDWTPDSVARRQGIQARHATGIWRVSQLHE